MAELNWRDIRQGDSSPVDDDAELLQSFDAGAFRLNKTAGSPIIGWRCAVAGHPGTWDAIYGGVGGPITLRAAYLAGSVALDQTLPLSDADGGGVIIDGSAVGFTGALSLRVNSAAAGPFVVDRANGYVGIGQATPTAPLEVAGANGSNTAILLSRSGHQRIEKTGSTGLSIVVPNTSNTAVNWLDFVMGTTSKIKVEPGTGGGPNGVITFNNNGVWSGTFAHWSTGETFITGTAFSGSQVTTLVVTPGALTNQNATVELNDIVFNLSHTVQQIGTSHSSSRAVKILAPTYSATSAMTVDDIATVYIDGAPGAGTNLTGTRKEALWIGAGNGGGIRTDGFGADGLIYNVNGGLQRLGVAGSDYVAPWSLTANSIVISAGGSALTEDNAYAYYLTAKHRAHFLGQTAVGSTVGFWLAGAPYAPTLTFASEDFDVTETSGPYRDTGFFGVADNMFSVTVGGLPVTTFSSQGIVSYGFLGRYLMGGDESGRTDASPLVIRGGASTTATGLTFDASAPFSATSGIQRAVHLSYTAYAGGFAPTSGTAQMRYLDLTYEVEQTGGANGAVVGINVDATVTALGGTHYLMRAAARGRQYLRVEDQGTSAVTWFGEQSTGITGVSWLVLQTNTRQAIVELDNTSNYLTLYSGGIAATALAGTGTQLVQANASGQLSRMTGVVPTSTVALTGPAVVFTDAGGLLNVDTTNFVYDDANNRLALGAASSTARLYSAAQSGATNILAGGASNNTGSAAIALTAGNGNSLAHLSNQITLGFDGTEQYRHAIRSRHNGAAQAGNAIDFFTWTTANTASGIGTIHNLSLDGGQVLVPPGTGSLLGLAMIGDENTGIYGYAADTLGFATAGRHTFRVLSDSTSRYLYLGEAGTGLSGYAYLGFETNARAGAIYLDNAVGNALISTVTFLVPNGSAASPSLAFTNSTDTGIYRYASGKMGVGAAGRHTARFESDSTSRFLYVGESATGITGYAWVGFETNARAGSIYLDNAFGNGLISTVPFYEQNGSYAGPSWSFVNDTGIGLYRDASGVLGLAGRILVGDGTSATNELFTIVGGTTGDLVGISTGGGTRVIADGATVRATWFTPLNFDVAKAAIPIGVNFHTVAIGQQTLTANGASGTARIGTESSTLYIAGPPVLSGSWTSGGVQHAVNVASGRVQIFDELNIGGSVANFWRNGGTPNIAFFGAGGAGQQVSGGTLAGVIAGLVAFGLFSS